jgi:hypothetical protein
MHSSPPPVWNAALHWRRATPATLGGFTPYAKTFLNLIEKQVADLHAMGLRCAPARETLLQMYAQPVINAQHATTSRT